MGTEITWGGIYKRAFVRTGCRGSSSSVIGLTAINQSIFMSKMAYSNLFRLSAKEHDKGSEARIAAGVTLQMERLKEE
jgi:hypothetical protein